jgi:hypothetical protein
LIVRFDDVRASAMAASISHACWPILLQKSLRLLHEKIHMKNHLGDQRTQLTSGFAIVAQMGHLRKRM